MKEALPDFFIDGEVGRFEGPHEIHVTVPADTTELEQFNAVCLELGIKPLVIDNVKPDGSAVPDYLTSSHAKSTTVEAFTEMQRISEGLRAAGIQVVRQKIETVPWHPYAPSIAEDIPIPAATYFESHLALKSHNRPIDPASLQDLGPLYISRNTGKFEETGILMATYRRYDYCREPFLEEVADVHQLLSEEFEVGKPMVEFALYDSNVRYDAEWLDSYENAV